MIWGSCCSAHAGASICRGGRARRWCCSAFWAAPLSPTGGLVSTLNLATPGKHKPEPGRCCAEAGACFAQTASCRLWLTWVRRPPIEPEARLAAPTSAGQISRPQQGASVLMCWMPSYGEPLELIRALLCAAAWPSTYASFAFLRCRMTVGRLLLQSCAKQLGSRISPLLHPARRACNLNHLRCRSAGRFLIAVFDAGRGASGRNFCGASVGLSATGGGLRPDPQTLHELPIRWLETCASSAG